MSKARILTLEEALEWNRETVWLQMRWWKAAQQVRYVTEHSPWLQFRGIAEADTEISVKGEEYGKTWRCFDVFPWVEDSLPWEDEGGCWRVEEEPEAEEE